MTIKIKNSVTPLPKHFFQDYKDNTVIDRRDNLVFIEGLCKTTNQKDYSIMVVSIDEYGLESARLSGGRQDNAWDKTKMSFLFEEAVSKRDEARLNQAKKADALKEHEYLLHLNAVKVADARKLRTNLILDLRELLKESKNFDQLLHDKAVVKITTDLTNIETILKFGGL